MAFLEYTTFKNAYVSLQFYLPTLESGIDVGPGKFVKKNKPRALKKQIYVTKNPSNWKISVDPGENSKI